MTATYTYTVKSDACTQEIEAANIDAAAAEFAAGEGLNAGTVAELLAAVAAIPGAWLWIESDDAPDGERQTVGRENTMA